MRRYTIHQLEAFASIAECGSFRIGAEQLGITQPSISLRIRELEMALGRRLFVRGKGGVRLSEAGHILHDYVRRGLTVFDEMAERLKSDDPLIGVLRLGASGTFAVSCLPMILSVLEKEHPGLQVELTVSNSNTLSLLLSEKKLDIAFMLSPPRTGDMEVEMLAASEIAWFGGPDLSSFSLRPDELARRRIMTVAPPSPFHSIIVDWFARALLPPPTLSTCNDMTTMVRLVRMGIAASVLPLVVAGIDGIPCHRIPLVQAPPLPRLDICAAYQRSLRGAGINLILTIARAAVVDTGLGLELHPSPDTLSDGGMKAP